MDAQVQCRQQYHTDLASIHNEEDMAAAMAFFTSASPSEIKPNQKQCWIGLMRNRSSSLNHTFYWLDGSQWDFGNFYSNSDWTIGAYPWGANNPNDYNLGEDCVYMSTEYGWLWVDTECAQNNVQLALCNSNTTDNNTATVTPSPSVFVQNISNTTAFTPYTTSAIVNIPNITTSLLSTHNAISNDRSTDIDVTQITSKSTTVSPITDTGSTNHEHENIEATSIKHMKSDAKTVSIIIAVSIVFLICVVAVFVRISRISENRIAEHHLNNVVIEVAAICHEREDVLEKLKEWITGIALPQYYDIFAQNGYDGLDLIVLIQDMNELKRIGIVDDQDQRTLWDAIGKLKANVNSAEKRKMIRPKSEELHDAGNGDNTSAGNDETNQQTLRNNESADDELKVPIEGDAGAIQLVYAQNDEEALMEQAIVTDEGVADDAVTNAKQM